MKVTPSRAARCSTRTAFGTSGGSPHTPRPVMRIAPKPRRLTLRSSPRTSCPAAAAFRLLFIEHLQPPASKTHAPGALYSQMTRPRPRSADRQRRGTRHRPHREARLHADHAGKACQMLAVDALEVREVRHHDPQQVVVFPGHQVTLHDFRNPAHR